MPKLVDRSAAFCEGASTVTPSRVRGSFTLEQELETFGHWVDKPIWVPPKDASEALAQTMLEKHGPFVSRAKRWGSVLTKHRTEFTQVREIELPKASIRLPQGRFFVSVTEQKDFDQITDEVPACVRTRLEEFLAGRGKMPGVKVYYLKPLCVEVGNQLILTSREDVMGAIEEVQDDVFSSYLKLYLLGLPLRAATTFMNAILFLPRAVIDWYVSRRRRAIEAYHAKLEFKRRQTALAAAKHHRKVRTTGCTYEDMLALTSPLRQEDVIEQFGIENDLSQAECSRLLQIAKGTLPWFVALSIGTMLLTSATFAAAAPPVAVCDPAFVAEMPDKPGVLLKIGHFDEVEGVTHIEL